MPEAVRSTTVAPPPCPSTLAQGAAVAASAAVSGATNAATARKVADIVRAAVAATLIAAADVPDGTAAPTSASPTNGVLVDSAVGGGGGGNPLSEVDVAELLETIRRLCAATTQQQHRIFELETTVLSLGGGGGGGGDGDAVSVSPPPAPSTDRERGSSGGGGGTAVHVPGDHATVQDAIEAAIAAARTRPKPGQAEGQTAVTVEVLLAEVRRVERAGVTIA